jgi:hypothetical protein
MEIGTLRKFLCTLSVGVALLLGMWIPVEAQRRRWRDNDNWRHRNYGQIVSASRHRRNRLRQSAKRRQRLQRRNYIAQSRRFRQRQQWWANVQQRRARRFRQRQQWWANTLEARRARFRRRQAVAASRQYRRQRQAQLRHRRWSN